MRLKTATRPMATMKTYVWRVVNNHYLQQQELVKKVKELLHENDELAAIPSRSLGTDPNKVFCLHAVNPAVAERFIDMVEKGETRIYQGSGRLGFVDALYTHVLTGQESGNKPFLAFTNPESIAKHLMILAETPDRASVVFRSTELPDVRLEGDDTIGVYRRNTYEEKISVEVALAKQARSNIVEVVSPQAAIVFLEELYQGLNANHVGVLMLADAIGLEGVQTKHDFINAFSKKLAEQADSPLINTAKHEAETLLTKQSLALQAGAEVADLLGEHDLSTRLSSLQQTLGASARKSKHATEVRLYHTEARHHRVHKHV